MKRFTVLILLFSAVLAMVGCKKTEEQTASTVNTEIAAITEAESHNDVLKYFTEKCDLMFTLWGPEGHDLYAFYIYPDHAERECQILMSENSDDVSEYQKDLSWEVSENELSITGEWQEVFAIDISVETATSLSTGKVYKIYEMQPPVE